MRSSTKWGLLEIAAQAIDAKCRGSDNFELLQLCEMIAGHHHESETKENLLTMLMLDESQQPSEYVALMRGLEWELGNQ